MQNSSVIDLNRFQIINKIGECDSYTVFLVEERTTKNKYTCFVGKTKCVNQDEQNLFVNNLNIYLSIEYPTLLKIFGYNLCDFENHPNPTIIADFLPHELLSNIICKALSSDSSPPKWWTDTKKYISLIGIALTMNQLHNNKIFCNLTLNNILFDNDYYPQIINIFQDQKQNISLSEAPYIAPEILNHEQPTDKSDIYSFSVIAYEIITNKRSSIEISNIKGKQNQQFFAKCFSKEPQERPTLHEICNELGKKHFLEVFDSIDYDEVLNFLDQFDEDIELMYFHIAMLCGKGKGEEAETISLLKKCADKGHEFCAKKYACHLSNKSAKEEDIFHYFKIAADNGDTESLFECAYMLQYGNGVPQNKEEAIRLYKKAIEKGYCLSMHQYAVMLFKGDGIQQNIQESIRYLKMACDLGDITSINSYFEFLENTDYIEDNIEEKLRYIKLAIKNGDDKMMFKLAAMYQYGEGGVSADAEEAIRYYKMAIENGNSNAMNNYAYMLHHGEGVPVDVEEAVRYYKMAIEKGNLNAMNNYAYMLHHGEGVPVDAEEAVRYYKMAIEKGDMHAMHNYATMLFNGEGIQKDIQESIRYLKMASDLGNADSINSYIVLLENSDFIKDSDEEKLHFIKLAINIGNDEMMFKLAAMYQDGKDGVPVDAEEAVRYYKMAIEKGNSNAMNNLGYMFHYGEGVPVDVEEAVRYYKMAIEKGNSNAMNNYARMLETGEAIPADTEEAVRYYKMAIEKGNSDAMNNLACMFYNGNGIPVDKSEAARYFKMAIQKGNDSAMVMYAAILINEDVDFNYIHEAFIYLEMAADLNNVNGICLYFQLVHKYPLFGRNEQKEIKYYQVAEESLDPMSMHDYACLLENGKKGVNVDKKKALSYYRMSACNGYVESMYDCARMLDDGCDEIEVNKKEALHFYRMATFHNHVVSMRKCATILEFEFKNLEEAAHFYKMAADNDDLFSIFKYSVILDNGEGVEINKEKSDQYFRKIQEKDGIDLIVQRVSEFESELSQSKLNSSSSPSSESFEITFEPKNPSRASRYSIMLANHYDDDYIYKKKLISQYFRKLGDFGIVGYMVKYAEMVRTGDGVPIDKRSAFEYFKKAADKGDKESMKKCAEMLLNGEGNMINKKESERYYKMAMDE